ncbi:MAG: hypothetical protein M3Z04_01545 [Chloroflexota bacterium]|nr:hypothetical protein [Chloroflexota bacterium]
MELRIYLNIILRYWWLLLLAISAGGAGAALADHAQTPRYVTQARVLMRPSALMTDPRDLVNLVGQVGSRSIAGTFAQAFTSAAVRAAARNKVGLSDGQAAAYTLEANLVPDSMVIAIQGSGPNPVMLVNYLNATTAATVDNTRDLFRVLNLEPLDTPPLPESPVSPSPSRDVSGGAGLGLGVGILLALAFDYLRAPRRAVAVPARALGGAAAGDRYADAVEDRLASLRWD